MMNARTHALCVCMLGGGQLAVGGGVVDGG